MKTRNTLGWLFPGICTRGTRRSIFSLLKFKQSLLCSAVFAVLIADGGIAPTVADEVHELNDGSISYEATAGVRDIFIWDMRIGATNGQQDIIAINGFDRNEDVLVFKAPATLDYANPDAPYIQSGVWANNVDSLVDTYYGEETAQTEIIGEGTPWEFSYEYYTYSQGSYRLLENSLERHNNSFGPEVFGEFEVEYTDVLGAGASRDIFQLNGTEYVGVTGVQELLVMGDGGILPLTIDVASLTSPFLFYNGVDVILPTNATPTAVATVDFNLAFVGTTSFFDGSGSFDPDLDVITYLWEITAAPLGSTAVLVDADTATPSLTTDVEGTYEVTLTVSDDLGPGVPASVEFVATTPNAAPSAVAGDSQSTRSGDTVYLDGSASFDDNTASAMLEYTWEFTSRPEGSHAVLNNSSSVMPTFVADVAGTYELALMVTDEDGVDSQPALVSISSSNLAPTAVPTVDFNLAVVGTSSFFDGSGSSDPELDEISYLWEITAAPLGSAAALVDADTATPSLTTDVEGTYEVTLTVSDFLGPGVPVSVEFVATTPQNFAEIKILEASDLVQALLPAQVTSKGNQTALSKFLKNATKELQNGNVAKAIDDLNKALERTDGCALRGSPDGNGQGRDWVIDCDAQYDIYNALRLAIDLLESAE